MPGRPAGTHEVEAMRRPTTILLGLVLGAASTLPAGLAGLATVHASTPDADGWRTASCPADGTRRTSLPGDHASLATGIATLDGRATWIVGMHAGQGIPRRAWIMRRSGSGWQEVHAAPTGYDGGLMAVDALRSDLAWSVGFHTTSRFLRPVSQRWDGHGWHAVGVPSSSRSEALVDVAIADAFSTWAVGFRTTSRGPQPSAFVTRSGRWERRDPGLPAGVFGSLVAVDIAPDGTPWAAGWQSDGTAPRPLVLRFTGGRWSRVATPLAPDAETVITDVDAAGPHVRLLGYSQRGTQQRALLWERDGDGWTADDALPQVAGAMLPTSLAEDAAGRPLISGAWRGPTNAGHAAMVGARVDGAWHLSRAADGLRGPSDLRGVAWADHAALAVGWTGGAGVATSLCDPWAPEEAHSAAPSNGLVEHDGPVARLAGSGAQARPVAGTARPKRGPAAANGIRFRDVAASVGLPDPTQSYGATVLDIDGDGWEDILLSRHTERGRVLRNRHGHFVPAAADPLPAFDRHGCAAADIDRDGHVDAYCAVGAARGAKLKRNELWLGLWTAKPRQMAEELGVDDPLGRGRRATFLDLDGDRYPDLLVTSDPLRVDGLPSLTRAWRNDGGERFVPADDLGLGLPVGGSCALSADLDGDGTQEVVICTEEAWGSGPGVHVLRRSGGRFHDATAALGIHPAGDVDAAAADLDGDRRADLVQLSRGRLTVSLQRAGGLVRVASLGMIAGTAVGVGDADGDGDLDLYIVNGGMGSNASDRLLLNRGDGRAYRSVAIPQAGFGTADDVVVLDHDHNGTDDFLVTNGAQGSGPVQLIAGFR